MVVIHYYFQSCAHTKLKTKKSKQLKNKQTKNLQDIQKIPRNTAYQILILLLRPLCIQQNYSLQMIKPQLKNILNKNIYMTAVTKHCELFPDNPSSLGDCRNAQPSKNQLTSWFSPFIPLITLCHIQHHRILDSNSKLTISTL